MQPRCPVPKTSTIDPALISDSDPANAPLASPIPDDAEDYLFWDVIHPTETAYRITAYRVCKTLDRQTDPRFQAPVLQDLNKQLAGVEVLLAQVSLRGLGPSPQCV